jgi:FkbM family methyltransferase
LRSRFLRKNLDLNKITNVKVIPAAVWKTSTTLKLDLSLLEPLQISSSTRLSADQADIGINVQAVSLDEVFASNQLQQVDLVKLDCEGAEFDIILESDADTIRSIKRFIMEYHDSLPGRHHSQLVSHLEQLGYRVVATGNVVHPEIGYLFAEQIR